MRENKMEFEHTIRPIAYIQNDFKEKFGIPRQSGLADTTAKIVFEPEYRSREAVRRNGNVLSFLVVMAVLGISEGQLVSDSTSA